MNMLSFLGETPTKALRKAQEECGEDAIVISTKKISDEKSKKSMYEVIVALEEDTRPNKRTNNFTKKITSDKKVKITFLQKYMTLKKKSSKCKELLNKFKNLFGILNHSFMI